MLERILREAEIPLVVTKEPGGTPIGKKIRDILLNPENVSMAPLTELFLYEADRAQNINSVILPALSEEKWVICDRFADATTVYQGLVLGGRDELIAQLNREATLSCTPDITFLLDCPAEVGLKRVKNRHQEKRMDRFDRQTLNFHIKIRYEYLALASMEKNRIKVVDSTLEPEKIASKIREIISPYLPR